MPSGGQDDDLLTIRVNPPWIQLTHRSNGRIQNEILDTSQQLDRVVGEWIRPAAVSGLFSFDSISSASHVSVDFTAQHGGSYIRWILESSGYHSESKR